VSLSQSPWERWGSWGVDMLVSSSACLLFEHCCGSYSSKTKCSNSPVRCKMLAFGNRQT